jgi:hypothetical protein
MKLSVFAAVALLAYTAEAQYDENVVQQREKKIEHPPFKASIRHYMILHHY